MKMSSLRSTLLLAVTFLLGTLLHAAPTPPSGQGVVTYTPVEKTVQGNQPLSQNYTLAIKSPANLVPGTSVTITLNKTILSKPDNVSDATTLSLLTLAPATLTFTGPNQELTTTVSVNVPLGDFAGNYAWRLTPSGWPSNLNIVDIGATVNARVSAPQSTDTTTPAITLLSPVNGTEYTYLPATGQPVNVPVNFAATVGTGGQPISGMQAFINGLSVPVTPSGLGTLSATATGTVPLTIPGPYTIRATATNQNGTSEAGADITVVLVAPPPTIAATSPAVNSVYSYTVGGSGVTVPVSFTATSLYGNITSAAATLNGTPITLNLSGVNSSLVATGSASLNLTTAGSYNLVFTATNAYGAATPVTVPFQVEVLAAPTPPAVTILTPANGTVYTRVAGSAATVVNYTFKGTAAANSPIKTVKVTIDGVTVTPSTLNGLNTATVTGGGAKSYTSAGTHVISVTVTNAAGSASTSSTFEIRETQPVEVCQNLTWLPPISLNKTIEGGSTMPIKFRLDCRGCFVRDTTTLIAIYEVYANGSTSNPVIYPYGSPGPNPPNYAITGNAYHLNFKTAEGVHRYRIEVYHPLTADGSSLQLLGSKDLLTKKASGHGCKSDKSGKGKNCKSGKYCKSDKSDKSDKSGKSHKSYKNYKSDKSDKSDKSCKSYKSSYSGKSDKSDKSDKSGKYHR